MRFIVIILSLLLFCAFASTSAHALQKEPSLVPKQAMQKIKVIEGKWLSTMYMSQDKGKTWAKYPSQKVMVKSQLNDLLIEQKNLEPSHNGWNMMHSVTYDQYRKIYRQTVVDDTWGLMDIYEGDIDKDGVLVISNVDSKTFFPGRDKTWLAFRIKIELTNCVRTSHIDVSLDQGKVWIPYIKYEYEKLNEEHCS